MILICAHTNGSVYIIVPNPPACMWQDSCSVAGYFRFRYLVKTVSSRFYHKEKTILHTLRAELTLIWQFSCFVKVFIPQLIEAVLTIVCPPAVDCVVSSASVCASSINHVLKYVAYVGVITAHILCRRVAERERWLGDILNDIKSQRRKVASIQAIHPGLRPIFRTFSSWLLPSPAHSCINSACVSGTVFVFIICYCCLHCYEK